MWFKKKMKPWEAQMEFDRLFREGNNERKFFEWGKKHFGELPDQTKMAFLTGALNFMLGAGDEGGAEAFVQERLMLLPSDLRKEMEDELRKKIPSFYERVGRDLEKQRRGEL